jgi:hypothetical protein
MPAGADGYIVKGSNVTAIIGRFATPLPVRACTAPPDRISLPGPGVRALPGLGGIAIELIEQRASPRVRRSRALDLPQVHDLASRLVALPSACAGRMRP